MYSTCLFCNNKLGANEVIELFPVGRRIAFDSLQGRLWVVCRACERWNLSPLDDRLEVIEACERLFSSTRMRVSTENIGLARLSEGLELVRIGKPMRPEFAAWRYGDQFGRRRRLMYVRGGVAIGAAGLIVAGATAAGAAFGGMFQFGPGLIKRVMYGSKEKVVARVPAGARRIEVKRKHLPHVVLLSADQGWRIRVPEGRKQSVELIGEEAKHATALLLPAINVSGGTQAQVSTAVNLIDVAGDPLYYAETVARQNSQDGRLHKLPAPVRLALEMATHEDAERRALEGELKALEIAWQEAEEVAAISDNLFTPRWISEWIKGR